MNTAIINIRTEPHIKEQAQETAENLGISLSSLINGFLRQLVKTKSVHFTVTEKPSQYLLDSIKQAKKERLRGKASPIFDTAEDAIKWLNDPKAKY